MTPRYPRVCNYVDKFIGWSKALGLIGASIRAASHYIAGVVVVVAARNRRCLSSGERRDDDEKCELIDANEESGAYARTRSVYRSHIYAHVCASRKYHDDAAAAGSTAGAWRYATCTRTQTHTRSVNSMAPVGYTDMHACVTSLYLFGYVRSVHKYSA